MDAHDLKSISRRPLRYWNEDGLTDIQGGVVSLVIGGMLWAMYADNVFVLVPLLLANFATALFGKKALIKVKERLVFPRTGAVTLREPRPANRWALTAVLLVAIFALAAFSMVTSFFYRWFPVGLGVTAAASYVVAWHRLGLRRYLLLTVPALVVTILLVANGPSDQRGLAVIMLVIGAAQVVGGAVALASYLRSAPLAPQE